MTLASGELVTTARLLGADLRPELTPVQVETNSPVCTDLRELREHASWRSILCGR